MRILCNEIIEHKNVVLRDHNEELKQQDEDFVASLKNQVNELGMLCPYSLLMTDNLLRASLEHANNISNVFNEEVVKIENSLMDERKALIAEKRAEYDALAEKRRALEL